MELGWVPGMNPLDMRLDYRNMADLPPFPTAAPDGSRTPRTTVDIELLQKGQRLGSLEAVSAFVS
jgi:hypothetical protein